MFQIVASLTDDSIGIIYDCIMFTVKASVWIILMPVIYFLELLKFGSGPNLHQAESTKTFQISYFSPITLYKFKDRKFVIWQNEMKFGLDQKAELKKSVKLYHQFFGKGPQWKLPKSWQLSTEKTFFLCLLKLKTFKFMGLYREY